MEHHRRWGRLAASLTLFVMAMAFTTVHAAAKGEIKWITDVSNGAGGRAYPGPGGVAVGPDGGAVTAGDFYGTFTYAGQTLTAPSYWTVPYVAKTDAQGVGEWAITFTDDGNGGNVATAVAIDKASGDSVVVGRFAATTLTAGTFTMSGTPAYSSTFVVRISPTGTPLWAKSLFGSAAFDAYAIVVDGSGNIFVAGQFRGVLTVTTTTGPVTLTSAGQFDMFVIKMAANGDIIWGVNFGSAVGYDGIQGIGVDAAGDAYVTGFFSDTITIQTLSGPVTLPGDTFNQVILMKLRGSDGAVFWANGYGDVSLYGDDQGTAISVLPDGTSFSTGFFQGALTAGPFTITGTQYYFDAYVLCSAPDGTPKWLIGLIGSGEDKGFGVAVDSMGNSYTTGFFDGTLTVGGTTVTATGEDIFILLLDASGQPVWIKAFDGNPVNGQAAAVGPTGDAWVTGWFGGSMTVPTSSGPTTLTAGNNDAFLLRLQGVRPALDVGVKGLPSHTVKVGAGQTRVFRAVITNKGNTTIADGVFELVPSDPSLVMLLPASKGVVPLWTAAINLAPKKSMRFVAKVMFPRCSPAGTMSFAALINDIPGPVVNVQIKVPSYRKGC